ncbi:MAG: hypothetical protein KC457_21380, partial [Myxococcales bacterium]|nr:hypothetical protein [Myxococcales bacterium]
PSSGSCDLEEVCDGASPSCPTDLWEPSCTCPENGPIAGYAEHDGLRAIDGSNFALVDTQAWAANQALIDELGLAKVGLDDLDLNRTGTPPTGALQSFLSGMVDYQGGFEWQSGDQSVSYWIPQGLSGGTSPNHDWVIVSWHYDETHIADDANPPASGDKGVRLSFAAVDDLGGDVPYRHVLLAQPDAQAGLASIDIHAGGLAFYPPYLYVADTSRGLRVFDTTQFLVTATTDCGDKIGKQGDAVCAYGYAYALPQVGAYFYPQGLPKPCKPVFSFLSLDQTSQPPSLISGEYDNDVNVGIYSRLLRFPLDADSKLPLLGPTDAVRASGAWYAGNRNIQGAAAIDDEFLLNATRYSGALFTGAVDQASTVYRASNGDWGWMPEGIHHDPDSGLVFIDTEGHANMPRLVFAADAASIP